MIILFDIDGVLVHSRAYHLGLQKTVAYFSRRLGLADEPTLTQADIDVFEAQSVTVEWESSAISVAALLMARLRAAGQPTGTPAVPSLEAFWAALDALAAQPTAVARPDFSALARRVGAATPPGTWPSLTALRLLRADTAGEPWAAWAEPWLEVLLGHCYDIERSPTMQVVQNFAVGDAQYAASYSLPPHFPHPGLLATEDTPNLSPALREQLLAERAAGRLWFGLYTARPSLPPVEVAQAQTDSARPWHGYTPEAEAALKLNGFAGDVPIMAVGKLDWIAQRVGRRGSDLVKPSPVEAMAALAAARTGLEAEALKAALAVERGDHLRFPLTACADQAVHVFEDSASSLRAVTLAVELLNAQGLNLTLTRHGIAPQESPKHAALAQIADHVHPNINTGLAAILPSRAYLTA